MQVVLSRPDLDEQQKAQMIQHIIQREIRQQQSGAVSEGVSPIPMNRG